MYNHAGGRAGKLLWQVLGIFVWKHWQSEMFEIKTLLRKLAAKIWKQYAFMLKIKRQIKEKVDNKKAVCKI